MFERAIVRILGPESCVVGTGFLITHEHIMTCCHVVNKALDQGDTVDMPQNTVSMEFPVSDCDESYSAQPVFWRPKQNNKGDIAILKLNTPKPASVEPVEIYDNLDLMRRVITAHGFPSGFRGELRPAQGKILSRTSGERLSIAGDSDQGFWIEPGFSGAPVQDDELSVVVGMVVTIDRGVDRSASIVPPEILRQCIREAGIGPITGSSLRELLRTHCERYIKTFEEQLKGTFVTPNLKLAESSNHSATITLDELLAQLGSLQTNPVYYLLGEFGTGKSWLMAKLNYELCKAWLQNPDEALVPFAFNLSGHDIGSSIEEIIVRATPVALRKHIFSPDGLLFDKAIYLLDSLDEAGRRSGFEVFDRFLQSVNEYSKNSDTPKITISSRLTFFREANITNTLFYEADPLVRHTTIHVGFWGREQVIEYVNAQSEIPAGVKEQIEHFIRRQNQIAGRALIASFLVLFWEAFKDIGKNDQFDEYVLFDKLIYGWLSQWATRAGSAESIELIALRDFINKLALVFLSAKSDQRIEAYDLEDRLVRAFPEQRNLAQMLRQLKTRSLLEMTNDRYYQFCHRAIWEFLVAKMIINAVEANGRDGFHKMVLARAKRAPSLYASISNQFVVPFMEKRGLLADLERFLSN